MSREQIEAAGYGFHHQSDDGKYLIMGNGTSSYRAGVTWLLGEEAETYKNSFQNELHRLLWLTETARLGYEHAEKHPDISWTWMNAVSTHDGVASLNPKFATDTKCASGIIWSDFSSLCIQAIEGWKSRGDYNHIYKATKKMMVWKK